jgi:hypothetical protein
MQVDYTFRDKRSYGPWTPADDALIARVYPMGGAPAVSKLLSRTMCAVRKRASRIGVECLTNPAVTSRTAARKAASNKTADELEREAWKVMRSWRGPVRREPMRWVA